MRNAPPYTESHAKDGTAFYLTSQCELGEMLKDATCREIILTETWLSSTVGGTAS